MDNYITRGPQCDTSQPIMEYEQRFVSRNSKENVVEYNSAPINAPIGSRPYLNEQIVADQHPLNDSSSTKQQLSLSDEIYNLKIKNYNLEAENTGLRKQIGFLKEQHEILTSKLNDQAIMGLKNYQEEKQQWKNEKDKLETDLKMYNGIIRSLDEDKRHMGEKISMLEMNLARPSHYPPVQPPYNYAYDPRDAMNTGYTQGNHAYQYDSNYFTQEIQPFTNTQGPSEFHRNLPAYDPLLTCDICGQNFLSGEIQKAREHLNAVHPTHTYNI